MAEEQEGKKRKEEMVAGYLRCFLSKPLKQLTLFSFKAQAGP